MKLDRNNIKERVKNTLMDTLKMEFIETDDEFTLEARMPVDDFNAQTHRVLHGGATIALGETIAGIASNILCEEDEACFGMQITASHVRKAEMGDVVRAKTSIIHKGRSTHVWRVDVISENTGKLISTMTITNAVVKKKKSY